LQLDAFEMRTHGLLPAAGKPGNPVPSPERGRRPRKDDLIDGQ
jgi:hypothetical protein